MNPPIAKAEMLIRKPPADVFNAFIDPAITSRFWFTSGSGKLAAGKTVLWSWEMYGISVPVLVKEIEEHRRILIEWPSPVEWVFTPKAGGTFVTITASGFKGNDDEQVRAAIDSMGGFCFTLAACKAFLEHGVELKIVEDHNPDAHVKA
jgi:uncharacterized protein YndB with AHSA1/START domain